MRIRCFPMFREGTYPRRVGRRPGCAIGQVLTRRRCSTPRSDIGPYLRLDCASFSRPDNVVV